MKKFFKENSFLVVKYKKFFLLSALIFFIFFVSIGTFIIIEKPHPRYDVFFVLGVSVCVGPMFSGMIMFMSLFDSVLDSLRYGNKNVKNKKEAQEYKEFLEEEARYSREYEGLNKKERREKFENNFERFTNKKRQNEILSSEKENGKALSEEKEWVVCALQFDSEPLPFINELIEGFGGQAIPTQKLEKLLDELLKEDFVKVDDEATTLNQSVCTGDWYALTPKGREFLEQSEQEEDEQLFENYKDTFLKKCNIR